MTEKLIEKPKMPQEKNENNEIKISQERKEFFKMQYGCDILKHKCTLEEAKDKNVPSDSFVVTYYDNGQICYDLTRSSRMVSVFDMYYDTFGNGISNIEWGYGTINPRNWCYAVPKTKKRR
tara:strand:+ start:555 stop:917 length:363 start_codon:yes stop_codon:yes gene_type:complete